jgi:hypothetical protein
MSDDWKLVGLVAALLFSVVGIFYISNLSDRQSEQLLFASLKGSIYEPNEQVSLFGTCRDADDNPINATATLSVWYPDGSPAILNYSMAQFELGHYLYTASMDTVNGTYLTMMRCQYQGMEALAYGEWQNPLWVRRIAMIQNSTAGLQESVDGNFNITFAYLNYLNSSIGNASSSIEGNLSAMDILIRGIAKTIGACVDCNLTYHDYYRTPVVYYKNIHIYAKVYNEFGRDVTEVTRCNITTNLWGTENMTYQDSLYYLDDEDDYKSNSIPKQCPAVEKTKAGELVEPLCPRMYYGRKVDQVADLNWTISCEWLNTE